MKNILRLISLIPGYKGRFARVLIANVLLGLTAVVLPYIFKDIIDSAVALTSKHTDMATARNSIIVALGILAFIRVASVIVGYYQQKAGDLLYFDTTWGIRKQIFAHLTSLSIDFYEQQRVGEIVERVLNATMDLRGLLRQWAENSLLSIMTLVFVLLILIYRLPPVGLLMTIMTPALIVNAIHRINQTRPLQREWTKLAEKTVGTLNETVSMIATVRSFGQEQANVEKFEHETHEFAALRHKHLKIEWRLSAIQASIVTVGAFAALAIVAAGVLAGTYTAGDILLVLTYVQLIVSNIQPVVRLIIATGEVEISAERVVDLLNIQPEISDAPQARELKALRSIEFRHVGFHYPGKEQAVLKDISFRLNAGQTLALVGPSGVGKTTITKLLLRFYAPTTGNILINGRDISAYTQSSIRRCIGLVMQDVALFNDTIETNIRFADPSASSAAIRDAARQAHADVFIDKLPEGYHTLVGERGIKLSGGEKQRIALARAILRNPQLTILDEATSALDSESEHFIQDALRRLLKGRTALIIAHRLSTVRRADQIIVLQDGHIIEQGSHHELTSRAGGLYARLFKLQTEGVLSDA